MATGAGSSGQAAATVGGAEIGATDAWAESAQGALALPFLMGGALPRSMAASTGP
jgi:hypothetical protein